MQLWQSVATMSDQATALFSPAHLEVELRSGQVDPAAKWCPSDGLTFYTRGIVWMCTPEGDEILRAAVFDAFEFRDEHGTPVSDERAKQLASAELDRIYLTSVYYAELHRWSEKWGGV